MLEIQNLSVSFSSSGETLAVQDVSFRVEDSRTTVMVGETGSGKSVLMLAILQLLPPTARVTGSVNLDGVDLLTLPEKKMSKIRGAKIGYVPQSGGGSMNPLLKVGFQVGEPLMEHKGYSKAAAEKASIPLLRKFGLGDEDAVAKSYPHQLSGGMRQRAMIAMGAAADASILFADEPTKGLDSQRVELVVQAFAQLSGKTILCVTHDLEFAEQISNEICVMYAAYLVEFCTKEEFFSQPLHPYSRALLLSQPQYGMHCTIGFAPPREAESKGGCPFYKCCPERTARCKHMPPMVSVGTRRVRCWQYAN